MGKLTGNPTTQCVMFTGHDAIHRFGFARRIVIAADEKPGIASLGLSGAATADLLLGEFAQQNIALSCGSLAEDDVFYKTEQKLYLSLTPETFYRAGLPLKHDKQSGKFLGEIDLTRNNPRLEWCAKNVITEKIRTLLPGGQPSVTRASSSIIFVPDMLPPACPAPGEQAAFEDWTAQIVEWAGLVAIDSPIIYPDNQLNNALCDVSIEGTPVMMHIVDIDGFFSPSEVESLWKTVKGRRCAFLVLGFADCPRCWGHNHTIGENGVNGYLLVRDGAVSNTFKFSSQDGSR